MHNTFGYMIHVLCIGLKNIKNTKLQFFYQFFHRLNIFVEFYTVDDFEVCVYVGKMNCLHLYNVMPNGRN